MTKHDKLPPECDELCRYRRCFHPGENKGSFVVGRGYTSYYAKPVPVCVYRMNHGCPSIEINGEWMRPLPDVKRLLADMETEVDGAKCTQRVRRLLRKLHRSLAEVWTRLERTTSELRKRAEADTDSVGGNRVAMRLSQGEVDVVERLLRLELHDQRHIEHFDKDEWSELQDARCRVFEELASRPKDIEQGDVT